MVSCKGDPFAADCSHTVDQLRQYRLPTPLDTAVDIDVWLTGGICSVCTNEERLEANGVLSRC